MANEGWNTEPENPGMKGPMFDHRTESTAGEMEALELRNTELPGSYIQCCI